MTETSDLKNISWNEKRQAYIIYIRRNNRVFYKNAYSLEDAIEIRNRALDFFNQHNRKPTSAELNLSRQKRRSAKGVESKSVECKMCRNEIDHYTSEERKLFHDRGDICGNCYRTMNSDKEVIENPDSMKHISPDKQTGRYIVQINRLHERFHLRVNSLDEAKRIRNEVIRFRIDNSRLPNREEKSLLFGVKLKHRRSSKSDSRAKDSTNQTQIRLCLKLCLKSKEPQSMQSKDHRSRSVT